MERGVVLTANSAASAKVRRTSVRRLASDSDFEQASRWC